MRIMVVTPKVANGSLGGAEYLVWGLSRSLAARGHRVEVFTTCSSHSIATRPGYLIWNNHFKEGAEKTEGVVVHRFPVRNNWPASARQARLRMDRQLEKEDGVEGFASQLAGLLEPGGTCLVSGWHQAEEWKDGPARWTSREARVAMRDPGVGGIRMRVFSPLDQELELDAGPGANCVVSLQAGEERQVELGLEPRGSLVLRLRAGRVFKPPIDLRELGVAVRVHDLPARRGRRSRWTWRPTWDASWRRARKRRCSRCSRGPRRPGRRGTSATRSRSSAPVPPAWRRPSAGRRPASTRSSPSIPPTPPWASPARRRTPPASPCIALPLFHPRDRYQYWPGILRHLREATRRRRQLAHPGRHPLPGLGTSTFAAGSRPGPGRVRTGGRRRGLPQEILTWGRAPAALGGQEERQEGYTTTPWRPVRSPARARYAGAPGDGGAGRRRQAVPGRESRSTWGPWSGANSSQAYACCERPHPAFAGRELRGHPVRGLDGRKAGDRLGEAARATRDLIGARRERLPLRRRGGTGGRGGAAAGRPRSWPRAWGGRAGRWSWRTLPGRRLRNNTRRKSSKCGRTAGAERRDAAAYLYPCLNLRARMWHKLLRVESVTRKRMRSMKRTNGRGRSTIIALEVLVLAATSLFWMGGSRRRRDARRGAAAVCAAQPRTTSGSRTLLGLFSDDFSTPDVRARPIRVSTPGCATRRSRCAGTTWKPTRTSTPGTRYRRHDQQLP